MEVQKSQRVGLKERVQELKKLGKRQSEIVNIVTAEGYKSNRGAPVTRYVVYPYYHSDCKVLKHPANKERLKSTYPETSGIPHDVIRSILKSKHMGDDEKVLALKICYRVR